MIVRFVKRLSPYQPGEIADFPDEEAEKLIKDGIAERVEADKKEADIEPVGIKEAVAEKDKMVRKSKVEK